MANPIISLPTYSDASTLTAGPGAVMAINLPVDNVLNREPSKVARFTDAGNTEMVFNLPANSPAIRVFWVGYIVGTDTNTTWRIRGATTEAGLTAAPGYDSGNLNLWNNEDLTSWDRVHAFHVLDAGIGYLWWRIDIGSGGSEIDIGRVYLSPGFQFTRGIDFSWGIQQIDASFQVRALSGTGYPAELGFFRRLSLRVSFMTETEALQDFMRLDRSRRVIRDLLIIPDFEDKRFLMDKSIYGYYQDTSIIRNQILNYFTKGIVVDEMEMP